MSCFSHRPILVSVALTFVGASQLQGIDGPVWVSNHLGSNQIWFRAEDWDLRDPDDNTYFEVVVDQGTLDSQAVTRHNAPGGMLTYIFDTRLGKGLGGPWTMWARMKNPGNRSDYMLVEEDPGDLDIPLGPPYPGGNEVFPFTNDDDRILEGSTDTFTWFQGGQGHLKELQDGENIMHLFHREGNESQLVDMYCWSDDPLYTPTDEDFLAADCVVGCGACPPAGDTHCRGVTVVSVDGTNLEGVYRVTIDAVDDGDEEISYQVVATHSNPGVTPVTASTLGENEVLMFLTGGTWTITATVDDDPTCDDAAADNVCEHDPIEVVPIDHPAPTTPFWVSTFGDAHQIWFRAIDWTERLPDTDDFWTSIAADGSLFGEAVTRSGGAGGCLRYDFDITEVGGAGGPWTMYARMLNPEGRSDYMLVEGDPGDIADFPVFDPFAGCPGGNGSPPFQDGDDRILEDNTTDWEWFAGGEGHEKTLRHGINSMFLFHREGRDTQLVDIYCWTDGDYVPNDTDFLATELRNVDCAANLPDTHCRMLDVVGPRDEGPGPYELTVTAVDDSDDADLRFTFVADNGFDPPIVLRARAQNTAVIPLGPGDWNLSAMADDDLLCPDEAADAVCSRQIVVRDFENLAQRGVAFQSSTLDAFTADLAIDGDFTSFSHTFGGNDGLGPATWDVDLLEELDIGRVVLYNRADCCGSRLRDITLSILDGGGDVVYESELLNPENELREFPLGPSHLSLDLVATEGGAVRGQTVRVQRTPDEDLSGTLGQGDLDEVDVLALAEVQVFSGDAVAGTRFARADVDQSGAVNLTDGIRILLHLFNALSLPEPLRCLDAADTDDSGQLNLTDGIRVFQFLFTAGILPPPSPADTGKTTVADPADCGIDPTDNDPLGCTQPPPYCQ